MSNQPISDACNGLRVYAPRRICLIIDCTTCALESLIKRTISAPAINASIFPQFRDYWCPILLSWRFQQTSLTIVTWLSLSSLPHFFIRLQQRTAWNRNTSLSLYSNHNCVCFMSTVWSACNYDYQSTIVYASCEQCEAHAIVITSPTWECEVHTPMSDLSLSRPMWEKPMRSKTSTPAPSLSDLRAPLPCIVIFKTPRRKKIEQGYMDKGICF